MAPKPKILGISGSLRARSSNTELLKAAKAIAADIADLKLWTDLDKLPHFNPDLDLEGATLPDSVKSFRAEIAQAAALVISTPEYAHGLPGSLKNALDWLVSGPEMVSKPIGILTASSRSKHAHAQIVETTRTMSANVIQNAVIVVPLDGRRIDAAQIAADAELAGPVRNAIAALAATADRSLSTMQW